MRVLIVCFLLTQGLFTSYGFPDGAPTSQCGEGGFPHHGFSPQTTEAPYSVEVNATEYSPGDVIEVRLSSTGSEPFEGFQALVTKTAGDPERKVGEFIYSSDGGKVQPWYITEPQMFCATHMDNSHKTEIILHWVAPDTSEGDLLFTSTFLQHFETFWVNVAAPVVRAVEPDENTDIPYPIGGDIEPLDFDQCGVTKGCFLFPGNCRDDGCSFAVAYKYDADQEMVNFHIQGNSRDYVAMAISEDEDMGGDETYVCTERDGETSFQHGINPDKWNTRRRLHSVSNIQVLREDGVLLCSFSRAVKSPLMYYGNLLEYDLTEKWHLHVATAAIYGIVHAPKKHSELPIVSTSKIDFQEMKVVTGEQLPDEIKLHATLALLAWLTLAGCGVILARHFRQELKKPACGTGLWFQMHRSLMILVACFSAAAIIIIFVHVDGWVKSDESRLHGTLGLVAMGCALLNVIMGFLRPGIDSKWRPFYNWGHRLFGIGGVGCAVGCAFLGIKLDFLHKDLRDDAFIILVIWVALQVAWAIVLEILSCCQNRMTPTEEEKPGMQIQDGGDSSNRTRQVANVKLFCLVLFVISQIGCFAAMIYTLYEEYN